uniref:F-box domain-containing protein n=1 Tax=Aegilops tauschii TaxID=37682 RepID=M8AP78_AEGTA
MAADRLSALPDALLQHILSFASEREAAASAVLSRRWRHLWRGARAADLDIRPYMAADEGQGLRISPSPLDALLRDAVAALAAFPRRGGGTVLKRLTLFLDLNDVDSSYDSVDDPEPVDDGRVAGLLADPAAAGLEEEGCLQAMVDAAPALTSLSLDRVSQQPPDSAKKPFEAMPAYCWVPFRLRCLTATTLELETYSVGAEEEELARIGIELDMPSLRSFRYTGDAIKLSLASPAPGLSSVDLNASLRGEQSRWEPTSRMLVSFSNTRALKLHVNCMNDIIYGEEEHGGAILPTFPNLKLLELDEFHEYTSSSAAVAMARLLRSCPVMSELRLNLNMTRWYRDDKPDTKDPARSPFAQSMDRFNRLASMTASSRRAVSKVSELPAVLTDDGVFSCLQTSLRKVTLQFSAKEVNCFQVQLAKFLVENAMVLEEMHVDDGNTFWPEHLCNKLERWRADSFRRRNLTDTAGFRVHQLE